METVLIILQALCSLAVIVVIMFQSGKGSGLSGAIGGGNDSYSFKAKAKTMDAMLTRWTKWVALAFVVLALVLNLI